MLQFIRERLTGFLAILVFIVLIIPFAFFGINNYFVSAPNNAVAVVNGEIITDVDFRNSFQSYVNRMSSLFGANFDITQFDQPVVRRQHLERMINQRVLEQTAESVGLAVSEEELQERIAAIPAFQVDGQFDAEVYSNQLTIQGLSPRVFEQQLAKDMVTTQIAQAIQASAIATAVEIAQVASLQNQLRTFQAVVIPASDFSDSVTISDADIEDYYSANSKNFMSEEQVLVEFVELAAADFQDRVEVSDQALEDRYNAQQGRFINPEQRLTSHILINLAQDADDATVETARQRAADLASRARGGEDFAALASEFSEDVGSATAGGDLGWVEPGIMVTAFEDALYELTEGEISDPVRTGFGFHVIQLREIQASTGMSFDQARQQLTAEFLEEETERLYLEQADRLVDLVYEDPSTLEPVANELGLEIQTTGAFDRSGGDGIAANPEVVQAAFSDLVLLEGSSSEPIEIERNHIVVIRVREQIPSALKELALVRDEIMTILKQERSKLLAEQQAGEWLRRLAEGATLEQLAEENSKELITADTTTRNNPELDSLLLEQVFLLPAPAQGQTSVSNITIGDDYAVIELLAVKPGDSADDTQRLQLSRQIANNAAAEENSGLVDYLRNLAEVKVFEDRL